MVVLLAAVVVGAALAKSQGFCDTFKPKSASTEGLYEQGEHANSATDIAGLESSDIVLEKVGNPSALTV